jgi:flagellar basal-body rod modification protein FlgD
VVSYLNNGLSATPQTNKADKDLGKDAFMQLLVAQMSNQNPLEPMENTQFISQLAQFSALEQQQNIAAGIEMLALTQTAATNSQMVSLIGKRVVVPGNQFSLDGQKGADLRFDMTEDIPPSEIIIANDKGEVVRRIDIDRVKIGLNRFEFDGKNDNGDLLEAGNYTYSIKSKDGEDLDGLKQYSNYLVDAVSYEGQSILLKSGSRTIDLADISEVIGN